MGVVKRAINELISEKVKSMEASTREAAGDKEWYRHQTKEFEYLKWLKRCRDKLENKEELMKLRQVERDRLSGRE